MGEGVGVLVGEGVGVWVGEESASGVASAVVGVAVG